MNITAIAAKGLTHAADRLHLAGEVHDGAEHFNTITAITEDGDDVADGRAGDLHSRTR